MSSKPASALPFGPDIGIFKRLRDRCSYVDSSQRETVWEKSEDLVEFFATNENCQQAEGRRIGLPEGGSDVEKTSQEDYEEILPLSYLFLGGEGPAKPFRRPGALHQARWMAKAIYCLKLQMLKSQLFADWSQRRPEWNEWPFSLLLVYCKQWHEAPISVKAPLNDVLFLEILKTYLTPNVPRQQNKPCENTCGTFSQENAGRPSSTQGLKVEEKKQNGQRDWTSPPRRRNSSDLGGKKMTMSFPSRPRHFEDTVLLQKLDGTRVPGKGPGIVGGGKTDSKGRSETGTWPPSGQRCRGAGDRPSPAYLGSTKSAAQEK
ncbi:hypothetical protein GWK47_051650 [Chionoecetes opilio]|uniref:Uncharacterized protein n=1 Tax=Chionoecetes opilio TaxID=41210 RepID=A0A8J4Y254_CHIOP|nr:hypothetical protein GWK47_051650 [Chionoecetes opilio]